MDTGILIVAIVWILLTFFIFKLAKSKNRQPLGWILVSIITSPVLILIILAIMPNLKSEKKTRKKRKKNLPKINRTPLVSIKVPNIVYQYNQTLKTQYN